MRRLFLVGAGSLMLATGCASVSPLHAGQTLGTIVGAAIAPGIGAPIGAIVGMLAGMVVQQEADKVTERRERKDLGEQLATGPRLPAGATASSAPPAGGAALQGEPMRVWVDETVQEGRLIAGHFDVRYLY